MGGSRLTLARPELPGYACVKSAHAAGPRLPRQGRSERLEKIGTDRKEGEPVTGEEVYPHLNVNTAHN
jgi:hypothetical protein